MHIVIIGQCIISGLCSRVIGIHYALIMIICQCIISGLCSGVIGIHYAHNDYLWLWVAYCMGVLQLPVLSTHDHPVISHSPNNACLIFSS